MAAAAPCVCPAHGTEFVRWVQSALNQVDSAGLRVTGVMDTAARNALRKFQSSKGLPVDGIAGPETEQALRDARGSVDTGAPAEEPTQDAGELFEFETLDFESSTSTPTLRRGSRGASVTDLQRRLAASGFSAGAADGIFGARTDAAVRSFQRARQLGVDGIVGPLTWGALLGRTPTTPTTPTSGSSSDSWVLPSSVRTAGDAQTVRYDSPPSWAGSPGNCTGTFTSGAATLKAHVLASFPGVSSIGGYSCRQNSANRSETSVHGTGRALDIMIRTVGGKANSSVGDPIANWLVRNAEAIGVQYIIWNRVRWSGSRTPRVARYTGPHPHTDHVHVELNLDGAARRTRWFREHEIADETGFELESPDWENETSPNCPPDRSKLLPLPGQCAPAIGDAACTQGSWYRPRGGDNLWSVARRTIRKSGQSGIGTLQYVRQISRASNNQQFLSRTGSGFATRQFLKIWGGTDRRKHVGRGGDYGLMFLPPFGPGLEKARCPSR